MKRLITTLCLITAAPIAVAGSDFSHGIRIGYAPNSGAEISGKHNNLYNPADPSSWRIEDTVAKDGEITDTFSIAYNGRNFLDGGNFGYEVDVSLNRLYIASQKITLDSQQGPFLVSSNQPPADATSIDFYLGGIYRFDSSGGPTPYVGAGAAYVKGRAYKTFYNLSDLLQGINTYGQSGSTNFDGHAFSVKAGMQFESFAIELEASRHSVHLDSYRSFEINGGDMDYDKATLSLRIPL